MNPEFVLQHISSLLPSWGSLSPEEITIERMVGITNQTYKISHLKEVIEPKLLIFRVFGTDCEGTFIDREEETKVYLKVGAQALGPRLYGYDNKIRCEEFIYSDVLKASQVYQPEYYRKLSDSLQNFHKVGSPLSDNRSLFEKLLKDPEKLNKIGRKVANLTSFFTPEEHKVVKNVWDHLTNKSEIQFLQNNFPTEPEMYCLNHNDLLANNCLIKHSDRQICFIDFEYCSINFRTYDIANFLVEGQFDYDVKETPYFKVDPDLINPEIIQDIVKYYAFFHFQQKPLTSQQINQFAENPNLVAEQVQNSPEILMFYQMLLKYMPIGLMMSNYYWTLWGIHMSKNPDIQFDYITFCDEKFKKYQRIKQQYFSQN